MWNRHSSKYAGKRRDDEPFWAIADINNNQNSNAIAVMAGPIDFTRPYMTCLENHHFTSKYGIATSVNGIAMAKITAIEYFAHLAKKIPHMILSIVTKIEIDGKEPSSNKSRLLAIIALIQIGEKFSGVAIAEVGETRLQYWVDDVTGIEKYDIVSIRSKTEKDIDRIAALKNCLPLAIFV